MKKLIIAALLASTTASASGNDAIDLYANVQAASWAAASVCPGVKLTPGFFDEMAILMEMSKQDKIEANKISVNRLPEIVSIANSGDTKSWCKRVVSSLDHPIQEGFLAPIYTNGGK